MKKVFNIFKKIVATVILLNIIPVLWLGISKFFIDDPNTGYALGWVFNIIVIVFVLIGWIIVKLFKYLFNIK